MSIRVKIKNFALWHNLHTLFHSNQRVSIHKTMQVMLYMEFSTHSTLELNSVQQPKNHNSKTSVKQTAICTCFGCTSVKIAWPWDCFGLFSPNNSLIFSSFSHYLIMTDNGYWNEYWNCSGTWGHQWLNVWPILMTNHVVLSSLHLAIETMTTMTSNAVSVLLVNAFVMAMLCLSFVCLNCFSELPLEWPACRVVSCWIHVILNISTCTIQFC